MVFHFGMFADMQGPKCEEKGERKKKGDTGYNFDFQTAVLRLGYSFCASGCIAVTSAFVPFRGQGKLFSITPPEAIFLKNKAISCYSFCLIFNFFHFSAFITLSYSKFF
jgi:hypothetical protein